MSFATTLNGAGGAATFSEVMRISDAGNVAIVGGGPSNPAFNPEASNAIHIRKLNGDVAVVVDVSGSATVAIIL